MDCSSDNFRGGDSLHSCLVFDELNGVYIEIYELWLSHNISSICNICQFRVVVKPRLKIFSVFLEICAIVCAILGCRRSVISTKLEISTVYLQDIAGKTHIVAGTPKGKLITAFGVEQVVELRGFQTLPLFWGLIRESDYRLIGSIH